MEVEEEEGREGLETGSVVEGNEDTAWEEKDRERDINLHTKNTHTHATSFTELLTCFVLAGAILKSPQFFSHASFSKSLMARKHSHKYHLTCSCCPRDRYTIMILHINTH